MYYQDYTGSLAIIILGTPFILVVIYGLKDTRKAHLMRNVNTLKSGEEFQRYINYFLTLIECKGKITTLTLVENNRNAAMALKGYVNHHSEFCPLDDCPLRNFKRQLIKD